MSARQKLNQANFKAALVGGLVVGWLFQSFTAFVLATFLFVVASFYSGDIRPSGDYHYPSRPSPPSRPPMSQLPNRRRSRKWRD